MEVLQLADAHASITETVAGMRDVLLAQIGHVDQILHGLKLHKEGQSQLKGDDVVLRTILTMIHMVGISGHSLLKLTGNPSLQVKDAYPIARTIIEGAINVAFIMAKGKDAAERAVRHAEVKAYRDFNRSFKAGEMYFALTLAGELPSEEKARLDAMLPEFTSKKGFEKDWTDENMSQRLEAISKVFPNTAMISLSTSAFNIYRHASEVVHGSYFSAIFFWGLNSPTGTRPQTRDDLRATLLNHQFSVLMSAIFAYAGLVECFATYAAVPQLKVMADEQIARLHHLPAIAEAMAATSAT